MRKASVSSTLTVYHDGQFWVGMVERVEDGRFFVAKITFGSEPSNEEVLQFVREKWQELRFVDSSADGEKLKQPSNPKRRMREASKALRQRGASTKAQQALAQARSQAKTESKKRWAKHCREEHDRRFEQRREKRKRKHRGK